MMFMDSKVYKEKLLSSQGKPQQEILSKNKTSEGIWVYENEIVRFIKLDNQKSLFGLHIDKDSLTSYFEVLDSIGLRCPKVLQTIDLESGYVQHITKIHGNNLKNSHKFEDLTHYDKVLD